ncbi:class I SAM-dependent methyltransferase (plasmid) [Skermanella sp. TT6]|uniref:Class I SAM-dependent methyltransferase n=1 Tax=Skermanella cutis TaxID=2775420 RepID=A0ABX7BEY2_9PROT|nr:class I SAM-dependent methyltransferase [Skermanella sp. TT6]QQP92964.1 class I SAM-dependent methyltransferase [Skermanella sp. TT6]
MDDAYRDIGRLYLALLSPERERGDRLGDGAMNRWMLDVPPGAAILDACCGVGNDVLALHRGIPAVGKAGPWNAFGSDFSESLLRVARTRTAARGLPADRLRRSSFADLAGIGDWRHRFDVVLAAHAIYTAPDGIDEGTYDDYLRASLHGMKAVLGTGGRLLTNIRDWPAAEARGYPPTVVENRHGGEVFRCRYEWRPGKTLRSLHAATLAFECRDSGERAVSTLRFVGRSADEMAGMFREAGFRVIRSEPTGTEGDRFITFMLQPVS